MGRPAALRAGTPPPPPPHRRRPRWATATAAAAAACASAVLLAAAAAVRPAGAHSFLTHPLPPWDAVAGCRVGGTPGFMYNCPGPCPNAGGYALRDGLDETTPTAVWARGESVEVRWARNNHEGGFVRLALVPLKYRDNAAMHKKYAFHYQCFRSDPFTCKTKTERLVDGWFDEKNVAFKTHVKVPRNIPNGIYVLGWAWYGGLHTNMPWTGYYGDYYSCSYVRIHGGGPLSWSHQPTWWTGRSSLFKNVCETSTTRIGECPSEPCVDHPRQLRVPQEFESGAVPPPLWRDMYPNVDNQTDAPPPPAAGELPPDQEELVSPVEYLRPTPGVIARDVSAAVQEGDYEQLTDAGKEQEDDTPEDELFDAPDLHYTATTEPEAGYENPAASRTVEMGSVVVGGTDVKPVVVGARERRAVKPAFE